MSVSLEQYSDNELYYLLKSDTETAQKAFLEIYSRHSARIFAYCRRFLGNKEDANDVFQEAFVRFFQTASQDRVMTNVPAFILKIARNLCVNVRRRNKETTAFEDYMYSSHEKDDKDELLKLIKMAMELLPEEFKEVFILREYDGLSYLEIADVTNTSLSSVKIRLFRAKKRIREILQPYLSEMSKY